MTSLDVRWMVGDDVVQVDRITPSSSGECLGPDEVDLVFTQSPTGCWFLRSRSGALLPVPPFDETVANFDTVPALPGVDVRWSWSYRDGPFGSWTCTYEVIDGRPVEITIEEGEDAAPDVDVWITFPFARGLQIREGSIGLFDVIEPPGTISGDIDVAMVMAGLITHEWTSASPLTEADLLSLSTMARVLNGRMLSPPAVT